MAISQAAQAIVAAIQANTAVIATLATSDGAQAVADLAAINDAVTAQTAALKATGSATTGLSISPATLPGPVIGTPYTAQLTTSGGDGSYVFSLAPASAQLPPGLSLSGSGEISGTPSTSGTYPVTINVSDTTSPTPLTGSANYTLTF